MPTIETYSLIVRTGSSKAKVRQWLKDRWIVKLPGGARALSLRDQFSTDSLGIRIAFIAAYNNYDHVRLADVFLTELGEMDANLSIRLKAGSHADIIKQIAEKYNIPYDLKRLPLFHN